MNIIRIISRVRKIVFVKEQGQPGFFAKITSESFIPPYFENTICVDNSPRDKTL